MKKFLIYVDILGFGPLAEKIGKEKDIESREVRNKFLEIINQKVDEAEKEKLIVGKSYGERDDWILVAENKENTFSTISKILNHHTGYTDYKEIPLEIAIGIGEYDERAGLDGRKLVCEPDTIDYLTTYTINKYREWYKEKYNTSIKETFIVITDNFYSELENFNKKKFCEEMSYKGKHFYYLPLNTIKKWAKTIDFFKKIGIEEKRYLQIENLYVQPKNFNEIKEKLNKEKIIFLIGDAEIGKTYTSIKLLLDSYNEGYDPVYYEEGKKKEQFDVMRDKFNNVLQNKTAVYFEDPWGKTEFESPEYIFRDIGNLINKVSGVDTRVIITSREKIFKKFEEKKEITEDLWQHVEKLKINIAYSKKNLKEMMEKYLAVFKPNWCENEKLKKLVFKAIDNGTLKTPMSIKKLIYSRASESNNEDILKLCIEKAAEETKIAFGTEITAMFEAKEYEKIVFLSFPYISDYFNLDFIKKSYGDILKVLNKNYGLDSINAKRFGDVLKFFEKEEVEVYLYGDEHKLKFSHPSYSDGFFHAINNKNLCENIFGNVLKELAKKDSAAWYVARAVANNFEKLPDDVRNLLFELAKKDSAAGGVAQAIVNNFNKLPEDVRNLLFKLAEKDSVAEDVARAVAKNFDKLPEDVRNLLFKLAEKDSAAGDVARAIVYNFEKLPEDVGNKLLFELAEKDSAAGDVAWEIVY
ncbi:MAG: hypothetical protein CVT89_03335, partial [Candidatus Altiarchaeales archaeon HGW-Altiarchaeales-2]